MIDTARKEQLNALLDGELSAQETAALAEHLAASPESARTLAELAQLRAALARLIPQEEAPADLVRTIEAALEAETKALRTSATVLPFRARLARRSTGWIGAAAAVAALLFVTLLPRADNTRDLTAVRDAALRSELAQVQEPAPSGPRAPGFQLASVRTDVIAGHRSRVLVYKRGGATITLCIWPANGEAAHGLRTSLYQGESISYWNDGQQEFWAASAEPDAADLADFVKNFTAG